MYNKSDVQDHSLSYSFVCKLIIHEKVSCALFYFSKSCKVVLKDKLQDIQLYELIFVIEDMRSGNMNSMTDYYLVEILKVIQESFLNDLEKCSKIAALEWLCRNILEWEQMKCMQYMMKIDPSIYANLVQIIYKSDEDGDIVDKEKVIWRIKYIQVLIKQNSVRQRRMEKSIMSHLKNGWISLRSC